MSLEKEIKLKIKDINEINKKIENSGAKLVEERYFEDNFLFDFPDNDLYKKGVALRLRVTPKKSLLTYKGKKINSSHFKIREEQETEIKDPFILLAILKNIGLEVKFRYQKFRTIYKINKLNISIDETPIGNFVELEGEEKEIEEFASYLGFSKRDFIKMDYIQIFRQTHKGDMVFINE